MQPTLIYEELMFNCRDGKYFIQSLQPRFQAYRYRGRGRGLRIVFVSMLCDEIEDLTMLTLQGKNGHAQTMRTLDVIMRYKDKLFGLPGGPTGPLCSGSDK